MQKCIGCFLISGNRGYKWLDNLKLGYGGTKEEMQRLLADAEKLSGTKFDISNFADIINAIHVIQDDIGIIGTTAKEAATTIQGSIGMLSAAWTNFLTGAADPTQDFDRLLQNVVDSFLTVTDNLMPRIQAVLPQLATGLEGLVNGILPQIPEMIDKTLPDVLKGADSIIQGLLDALTNGIQTAGPIISESAPVIVKTLVDGIAEALPGLVTAGVDIIGELLKAVLDNAGELTEGAVDIITAFADGLTKALPELVPAAVEAVTKIVQTLLENVPEILDAAEDIISALAEGLLNALPTLLEKAPQIVIELLSALVTSIPDIIDFAVELCMRIGDYLATFDWSKFAADMYTGIKDALSRALTGDGLEEQAEREQQRIKQYEHLTAEQIDSTKKNLVTKLGELNEISVAANNNGFYDWDALPEWVRRGVEGSGLSIQEYIEGYKENLLRQISDLESAKGIVTEKLEDFSDEFEGMDFDPNNAGSKNPDETFGINTSTLEDELKNLENLYATHKVTEEEYWAGRKAILDKYRDDDDAEWWKLYDKVTDHYDKLAETEAKAAEKAAKEAKQAEEKAAKESEQAAKDYENSIKDSISDKFRELETEQLEKGYDDSWLLEQKRAFLETLDHNSEAYKDYNLKLLKEQETANNKALKEAQTAADKAKDALEKSYDNVVKSRDSLASSLSSSGDLFKSSEETDKRTGEKKKSQNIGIDEYKKKVEAKKKLTSKIAKLLENDMPMDMVKQLLKQDPEEALKYAEDLLKSPKKLSELKKAYAEDEGVSNILANMVTESSDEFKELGTEAGDVFGESFMEAFKANWEEAFKGVFDDDYLSGATVSVSAANASAGNTVTAPASSVQTDSSETARTGTKTSLQKDIPEYVVVNLNKQLLLKAVRDENKKYNTIGGG